MGFLSGLVSVSSFLSGIVFGILICAGAALQFLRKANDAEQKSKDQIRAKPVLAAPNPPKSIEEVMKPEDVAALTKLIKFLDDFNAPLKSIGGYLQQIYTNRDAGVKVTKDLLDRNAKVMIEIGTVTRMEKELYDALANLKEHGKMMKNISSFLADLSKAFASFSKDLNRLSNTAKNNMYKGLKDLNIDTKEDLIINNWWQALHVSLDYMSSDQDYLATQISDDLLTFSNQIHDELNVIEKRLSAEGSKQVHNIKEQLSLYESKRRERDKYREKVRVQGNSATLTTQSPAEIAQRRALKMRINDDQLTLQATKLFAAQKEFFSLMPRIDADIQLTILKSIVETHAQLLKLTENFERQQESNRMISKRMKLQLTNAAASLMQMIREEGNLLAPTPGTVAAVNSNMADFSSSITADSTGGQAEPEIVAYEDALRAKMMESGVQGYELSLQKVLEGLLQHCQHFDFTYGQAYLSAAQGTSSTAATVGSSGAGTGTGDDAAPPETRGELNMAKESTACLAATNPAILPLLPSRFGSAVGVETCVWFNAFSGRVYRDISHSNYFYNWFSHKLTIMLNKGTRPDYIDEFKVHDVQFGALPPMLLNVQWSPPCRSGPFSGTAASADDASETAERKSKSADGAKPGVTSPNRAYIYDESDSSESEREAMSEDPRKARASSSAAAEEAAAQRRRNRFKAPPPKPDDSEFFSACTAEMAYRSGIKFTVTTKLWINWPRDRYASVPVSLHLDLAEISGRIRFGVTRGHSFFSFLGDPLMRINVRNEVGKGAYKFKDFPQLSEYITKKLKAYVHNKIVHPHSHKFRLIWPRNWWPEGTQGEFGGDGEDTTSQNFNQPRTTSTTEASASAGTAATVSAAAAAPATVPVPATAVENVSAPSASQRVPSPAPVVMPPAQQPSTPEGPVLMTAESNRDVTSVAIETARTGGSVNRDIYDESDKASNAAAPAAAAATPAQRKADDSKPAHNASTSNMRTTSVSSMAPASETSSATTSSVSSSSSYQAMRSKVTTWMQNHSRRGSAVDHEDHYHPLSKAAAQAAQASASPAVAGSVVSPHTAAARRPSASEQMKALMTSARQSSMFRANSVSANTAEAASSTGAGEKRADKDENEAEAMFDRMALQSLTSLQQEIVKDNLAWDMEVKSIVSRFADNRKRTQTAAGGLGSLPNTPAPASVFGSKSPGSSDYAPAGASECDTPLPSYRTAQRCLAAHGRGRLRSVSSIGMDDASVHAPGAHTIPAAAAGTFVEGIVVSPPRGRTSRANSITSSVHGPPEPLGVPRSKSFTAAETPDTQYRLSRTNSDAPLPAEERRLRSYSVDDFRPEVLDAMFRIHILENSSGAKAVTNEDPLSAAGKYRTRPCIYAADPYRSVDDASYGYSSQRPMQFAQNKLPQYRPANWPANANAATGRPGTAAGTGERSTFSNGTSGGSAAPRTSTNPLHGVDIAAKFAEFKAKHLNNRDLFPRKKEDEEFSAGMREALVDAEDDPDLDGGRPSTSRGSISGASSSSAALKYMSNMIRSKFNSAMNPESAEKAGKGPP